MSEPFDIEALFREGARELLRRCESALAQLRPDPRDADELWRQIRGEVDCFVAGVGSGGTLQGVGRFLKEHKPGVHIVAVEPRNVSALLGHEPGLHQIQGIGDGFVPDVLDVELVDMVFTVSDEEAIETTRRLSREEGLLVGGYAVLVFVLAFGILFATVITLFLIPSLYLVLDDFGKWWREAWSHILPRKPRRGGVRAGAYRRVGEPAAETSDRPR